MHASSLICLPRPFQNLSLRPKTHLFLNFAHFCTLKDAHAYIAWSWKTTLIMWIFLRRWYQTSNTSGPWGLKSRQGRRSVFDIWGMIWWRVSANCALARTGGVWGGLCPLRSWKMLYFCNWNRAIWWIGLLLGANLEQAIFSLKKTQFFGPDGPKFCILREIVGKMLLESFRKTANFRAESVDFVWIYVKIGLSQSIVNFSQHWGDDYIGHPPFSNGLFQIIMNHPLWRTSEFRTFFSPFFIGISYLFRQCSWNFWLLFAAGLGNSDTFLIWFLEFHTISSYFQFEMREGRYRGHWNSRHLWSCLYSGFLYLFPLTYSGRYRGHWNSIQFCIQVIVWFWMLLKTRQYNQHDTGREKLLCEYELMKTKHQIYSKNEFWVNVTNACNPKSAHILAQEIRGRPTGNFFFLVHCQTTV